MSSSLQAELAALREAAAIAPLPDRAFLRITGSDATRWLNGMVTNNIAALAPGEGNYNFLLNAQGRIQGDCTLYREPGSETEPSFLLETHGAQLDTIHQHLDRFIIMDDVEIAPMAPTMTGMLLLGPNASWPLTSAADSPLPALGGHAGRDLLNGHEALILTPPHQGMPAYEVWFASPASAAHTFNTLRTSVGIEASPEALEALRILEARPKFGQDITEKYLPQETALNGGMSHALHFSKGCYLGQEIVERIHSRGQVHRTFTRFRLTGSLPETLPARLESDSKPAGELTSAALIGDDILALGYVRRELLDTHAPLTYPGGAATASNP